MREEGRARERSLGNFEASVDDQEQRRGEKREASRQSKRQHKRDTEKEAEQRGGARRSGSSASSPALTPSSQEGALSDNQVRGPAGTTNSLQVVSVCHLVCLPSDDTFIF